MIFQIVGLKEKKSNPCEMEYTFFLVFIKQIPIDECSTDDSTIDNTGAGGSGSHHSGSEIPKTFLRVMNLIEFDTFVATHGPGTYVDGERMKFHPNIEFLINPFLQIQLVARERQ